MSQIESTYKAKDVEEVIDIYFYRPVGYYVALASRALRVTPNLVTIVSIVIGVGAGFLLRYADVRLNVLGLLLWVAADILDSADGQLARMTNHKSKFGRILDGFGGNIIFTSIYLNLYARLLDAGYSPWILGVVLLGGVSHSLQSSLADYYRNAYLKYVVDPQKSELHSSADVREEYGSMKFPERPVKKFLLRIYLNYTRQQEALSKNFQKLRSRADAAYGAAVPEWFRTEYRRVNKPLMKYYAILTTNTRMIAMSVCVLLDRPLWYFGVEIVLINLVMIFVTRYQEDVSKKLLEKLELSLVHEIVSV